MHAGVRGRQLVDGADAPDHASARADAHCRTIAAAGAPGARLLSPARRAGAGARSEARRENKLGPGQVLRRHRLSFVRVRWWPGLLFSARRGLRVRLNHTISLEEVLQVMLTTAIEDVDAGAREPLRRFHERGQAALAAEELRPHPRDAGVVLLEAFGGGRLRAAFLSAGPAGLMRAIDRALAGAPS